MLVRRPEILKLMKAARLGYGFEGQSSFYAMKDLGVIRPSQSRNSRDMRYDWELVKRSIIHYRDTGEVFTEEEYFTIGD